jgi:glycosyltransferase involved in cell wall biosynthesis
MARALKADIYHLHDPELLTIALALKRSGSKIVFDAHEDVPKQILAKHYLHPWVRRLISHLFAAYERYVCARLDGIVAATPTIRDKFKDCSRRVVDINNFPLPGELDSHDDTLRSGNEVCYIGGIATIRGIREIVRAVGLSRHGGVQLHLAGRFVEPDVESELRILPAWSRVKAWGHQERSGVKRVLSRSSVGLVTLHPMPNYLDSLPIKMFEYMAAGIPVIASDFPLWRSIVEGADCGICVDPLEVGAIADAIDGLLADPIRAARMGQNGRRAVQDRFNWGIEEKKLLEFYAILAKAPA